MVRRADRSIVLLALVVTLSTIFLTISGETRVDAYLAVTILVYFAYSFIDRNLRSITNLRVIDIILLSIFIAIIAYRVSQML